MSALSDIELFEQILFISGLGTSTHLIVYNSQEAEEGEKPEPFEPILSYGMVLWPVELFGKKFHILEHFCNDQDGGRGHFDRFKDRDVREFWPEYFAELLAKRKATTPSRWERQDWRGLDEAKYSKILDVLLAEGGWPIYGIPKTMEKETTEPDWWLAINCSDVFFYAASDSQICYPDEIDNLHEALTRWGRDGTAAWCGVQRGWDDPIKPADTAKFREAEKWLLEKATVK